MCLPRRARPIRTCILLPMERPASSPPISLPVNHIGGGIGKDIDGEAGKFTTNIFAYPTTYVVDRNGNIVGAITEKKQAEALQAQIDKALAADMG